MDFVHERKWECPVFCVGKATEGRKECVGSRHRYFLLVVLLATIFFLYRINSSEKLFRWSSLVFLQRHDSVSVNTSSVEMTSVTSATHNITPIHGTLQPSGASQHTNPTSTPVPYKSPGLYVVEYPYRYTYVINQPHACEEQEPYVVLVVPVAPKNRAHRDIIRSTWGGQNLVQGKVVALFFLLGLHSGEGASQVQEQVLQESREHGDLVQSNFLDCYKNLTIKTMVMLEWLDTYCSNASYAMKIDSDMFLNVPNLINMLSKAPKTNYMTGLVAYNGAVLRDTNSKWYLPQDIFPETVYPRYALGLGYVLSLDLPKKLVEASRHVTAVYIEDVYLGLCLRHLGIPPTDPFNRAFHVFPVTYSRCAYSRLIATTTAQNSNRMATWKDFIKPGPYC
ncbi:beta-1,3-galactosyltransferase 1-like [Nelusetta ayraudi]|uniref:beta-1,3-galactosyltransferase 1-like n=1 Tax=Nelusetta ayraudi TaxID=303726 RepID=UPI003F705992